jgi:crossover junction endodeoxyribonuclease RuvC
MTGNGFAKKPQIQKALQMVLALSEIPKPDDAADALAIAYLT